MNAETVFYAQTAENLQLPECTALAASRVTPTAFQLVLAMLVEQLSLS